MKLLVLLGVLVVVGAKGPITVFNYHQNVGVLEAHRIKQAEEAQGHDGARLVGGLPSPIGLPPYMLRHFCLS